MVASTREQHGWWEGVEFRVGFEGRADRFTDVRERESGESKVMDRFLGELIEWPCNS